MGFLDGVLGSVEGILGSGEGGSSIFVGRLLGNSFRVDLESGEGRLLKLEAARIRG